MSQRLPPSCRYIYVIGPEAGLQKIGIATDPRTRLAALQTASPVRLVLHASIPVPFGAAHDVRRAHHRLRAARGAGEWFNVTVAEAIEGVRIAASTLPSPASNPETLPLFAFTREVPEQPSHLSVLAPGVRSGLARIWKIKIRGRMVT